MHPANRKREAVRLGGIRTLSIDIETFSSVDLVKSGVYRYAEAPDFRVLLFGYSVNDGPVQVEDMSVGGTLPLPVVKALVDPSVEKNAFNASFERVCLSRLLRDMRWLKEGEYLDPAGWHCTMIRCAYLGLPLSLASAGEVLGLDKQKLTEGKELIRFFCKPVAPSLLNGQGNRNLPGTDPERWRRFVEYNRRDVEAEMQIQEKLRNHPVPDFVWKEYELDQQINDRGIKVDISEVLKSLIPDYKDVVHSSLLTAVEEISILAEKEPKTIPFCEDDLVVFAHSMPVQKSIKEFMLNIGETETILYGKDDQGVLVKEDIDHVAVGYDESEALALVLTRPVDILYQHNNMVQRAGAIEHSVIRFLQKLETVAKMQVKQHLYKASVQMCKIFDELTLTDSDYVDYYYLTRIMAGLLLLEGSHESAICKYIQLLDKLSISHGGNQIEWIQKHVLVDVAEIYIKMEKFSDAQKFLSVALGMNDDAADDINIAANIGLLKIQIKTGNFDSADMIAGKIKDILLEERKYELLESDYEYFELYCEACFEYVRFLNFVEQNVQDIEIYQSCEETIDTILTIVLNEIENAHRNSRLHNYDLLIELYMLEGNSSIKPHKINNLDYTDWGIVYFQQVLKLYNKARQNGEYINQKEYIELMDLIKKLLKKVKNSSRSQFYSLDGENVISKKVDVNID